MSLGRSLIALPHDEHAQALLACATAYANPTQREVLDRALAGIKNFSGFAERAEREGIATLVTLHAGSHPALPAEERALLRALSVRHKLAARARTTALQAAIRALDAAQIPALFTKGAALAWLAYPSPELRPMRDVDLLVDEASLERAALALLSAGFGNRTNAPPDCHEVYTLDRVVDGFSVRIDMHRRIGLFELPCYRPAARQTLDALFAQRQTFQLGTETAAAPAFADLLRIVHRHAFALGLYERYRYNAIADLASAAERWIDRIDWAALRDSDRLTYSAFTQLDRAVPLSTALRAALALPPRLQETSVGLRYAGLFSAGEPLRIGFWAQLRWARGLAPRERGPLFWGYDSGPFFQRLRQTLSPPLWWLQMRHGRSALTATLFHLVDLASVAWRRWRGRGNVRR